MKVDLKTLVAAILSTCPKAPVSFRSDRVIVFRGVVLVISDTNATSERINFTYDDPETFLGKLQYHGLMLKPYEVDKILAKYYLESF